MQSEKELTAKCDHEDVSGNLLEQIARLKSKEARALNRLKQVDALRQKRLQPLEDEIRSLDAERADLQAKIRSMQVAKNKMPCALGPSYLHWVDIAWFSGLANLVILLLACMVESTTLEHAHLGPLLAVLEQLFLASYVLELAAKAYYNQRGFFVGKFSRVWCSWLDLGIVVIGMFDQCLIPLFVPMSSLGSMSRLGASRISRVMRVLRLLMAFWSGDFSWTEEPLFETFMAGIVAVNSITLWLELDYDWPVWPYAENAFLTIYCFELVVRIRHLGCGFFTDTKMVVRNVLDFIVVVGGALDLWLLPAIAVIESILSGKSQSQHPGDFAQVQNLLKVVRILRLVRLLRTINRLHMRSGVMEALMAMQWVAVLAFVGLYAGAVTWKTAICQGLLSGYSEEAQEHHDTVPKLLLKLMNHDTSVEEPISEAIPGQLLLAGFRVLSTWAAPAILTSVARSKMRTSSARPARRAGKLRREAEQAVRAERVRGRYGEGSGASTAEEAFEYLEKPKDLHAGRFVGYRGKSIASEDFIDHIDGTAAPAGKRLPMHLIVQLRELQKQVAELAG